MEDHQLKRFAINFLLSSQKAMICEEADDKAKLEELQKQADEANRCSSSLDDMITQKTTDMEWAKCRLRAREAIFKGAEEQVDELVQQTVNIDTQISDIIKALKLSTQPKLTKLWRQQKKEHPNSSRVQRRDRESLRRRVFGRKR